MRKLFFLVGVVGVGVFAWVRRRARSSALESEPADTRFMVAMHDAFRRDLDQLERAATAPMFPREGWRIFREELEFHHTAEDEDLWPDLRGRLDRPDDIRIVDEMVAEHERIAPALEAVERSLDSGADVRAPIDALVRLIRDHLDHEERTALPLVRTYLSNAEWHRFLRTERSKRGPKGGAQFLSWVLEDANDADSDAVLREVPGPGRLVYRYAMKPRWEARHRWEPDTEAHREHTADFAHA